jgi:hypothetical protein
MQDDETYPSDVVLIRVGGDGRIAETQNRTVERPRDWNATGDIRIFLIVSRFESDHALTYLFCDGPTPAPAVQRFVDGRPDRFRGNNVVVELGENYFSLAQAKHRAVALRSWLQNVNIIFPPLKIQ